MATRRTDIYVKAGDTRPRIKARLSADATDVFSSVLFHMAKKDGTLVIEDGVASIEEQPSAESGGIVSYQWVSGDTDDPGEYNAEFEVHFNDGRIESYPNSEYLTVHIIEGLN